MKNRINTLFENKKKNILSVYFCAGNPQGSSIHDTLSALQTGGIDMIEIGLPFSDPLADGPVIQQAATEALRGGMSVKRLFEELEDIRKNINLPLILMGYLNPILHYGFEAFCKKCEACGIDGLIVPDLPFEVYEKEFRSTAEAHNLHFIFLVTPETPEDRIRQIDQSTHGFIYAVSSASVTGAQRDFNAAKQAYFARLESMKLNNPFLIGFGISNKATREAADAHAAGVIVGSKFVMLQQSCESPEKAVEALKEALEA